MSGVFGVIWHGIRDALLMGWQVWWALAFGFFISGVVQAWVPRSQIETKLGGRGLRPLALATGLGAASSSCSYAAIAIAKSLFQRGASLTSALAFQFASTNLVWELGLVIWILIGWQFTLAEFVGGILMVVLMAVLLRVFVSPRQEDAARDHAAGAQTGHQHHMAGASLPLRQRLTSVSAWSDVAHNFRGDWQMLWREIGIGMVIAGFVAQLDDHTFARIFLNSSPPLVRTVWGAAIGPIVAMLTFVCSVGNVPVAAVLWSGGISFAGVLAFIFADLVILPIVAIYRKYYGGGFALRIVVLMLVTMAVAALAIQGLFDLLGLVPHGARVSRGDLFPGVSVNYTLVLNVIGFALFATLFGLTFRRGAVDPVCGMAVDRSSALQLEHGGTVYYFCCEECRDAFAGAPQSYLAAGRRAGSAHGHAGHAGHGHESHASSGFEVKL